MYIFKYKGWVSRGWLNRVYYIGVEWTVTSNNHPSTQYLFIPYNYYTTSPHWLRKENPHQKPLNEFAALLDSQGTRRAYKAKTAKLANNRRNEGGGGACLGFAGSGIYDRGYWDEFHPHVQGDRPFPVLCVAVADGVGRILSCKYSLPDSEGSSWDTEDVVSASGHWARGGKVGQMLNVEVLYGQTVEGCADQAE